jgi:hypothetical protein
MAPQHHTHHSAMSPLSPREMIEQKKAKAKMEADKELTFNPKLYRFVNSLFLITCWFAIVLLLF